MPHARRGAEIAHAPPSEDTEPHCGAAHHSGVAVVRQARVDVVLGVAATEADEVRGVTTDDEETARRCHGQMVSPMGGVERLVAERAYRDR